MDRNESLIFMLIQQNNLIIDKFNEANSEKTEQWFKERIYVYKSLYNNVMDDEYCETSGKNIRLINICDMLNALLARPEIKKYSDVERKTLNLLSMVKSEISIDKTIDRLK